MDNLCCDTAAEYAIGVIVGTSFATGLGTSITSITVDPDTKGNVYKALTVINDTDQDIKVSYATDNGYTGSFIVPKSIKGYTKFIIGKYDNTNFKVISLGVSAAAGNVIFNLSA